MKLLLALIMTINISSNIEKIVLGGGCFWCIEAIFEKINGVIKVESGYAGGNKINPSYNDVTNGLTNHAEVCKITYDKTVIDLKEILDIFYVAHDPTQINRQGNDIGRHYRSIILYGSKEEETYINNFIDDKQKSFENKIVTEVKKLDKFFVAEKYHQNYFELNSSQPYCRFVILPKLKKVKSNFPNFY
tara:strand:- start:1181 stop:1747 length:567 start_codon:yes stop_codon:yes gene_type:complete